MYIYVTLMLYSKMYNLFFEFYEHLYDPPYEHIHEYLSDIQGPPARHPAAPSLLGGSGIPRGKAVSLSVLVKVFEQMFIRCSKE